MENTKPFNITKRMVFEAYQAVKANRGGAGIDKITMREFETKLSVNLYKIWNRLASGTYFPPAVKSVEIPKSSGGTRILGIPTIGDRIAQMVVKRSFEPKVERFFVDDSYGYRPGKSAHMALEVTRSRCWKYDWILEFDIKGLFDNIDHELLMKAVNKHTMINWELLYIKRWLACPSQSKDGEIKDRASGVPQGGVISPVLSNLFMHYAFDMWMKLQFPNNPFCRYADDAIVHCKSKSEAELIKSALKQRMNTCKLELHPTKTKVVYCKDSNRKLKEENMSFTFLGYTFMPRKAKGANGKEFTSFLPAISQMAQKRIRQEVRNWKLLKSHHITIEDLAIQYNPVIRGWLNYYGKYGKNVLRRVMEHINYHLMLWTKRKYRKYKGKSIRAVMFLEKIAKGNKNLFEHWKVGIIPSVG